MFDFTGFLEMPRPFVADYKCFSVAMCAFINSRERSREIDCGGKILMPHSALDWITRLHLNYPMLFKITNLDEAVKSRSTHCGVLEFHQEEGVCYLPHWMMRNLLLSEGGMVRIKLVNLPVGSYVKLKPQDVFFTTLFNPSAVLELKLRNFACLTKGDMIAIEYNNKVMEFYVQELRPADAVSIIECDMNVEFDTPATWSEAEADTSKESESTTASSDKAKSSVMSAKAERIASRFPGSGTRLDGKAATNVPCKSTASTELQSKTAQSSDGPSTSSRSGAAPANETYEPDFHFNPDKFQFVPPPWFKEGSMDALGRPLR